MTHIKLHYKHPFQTECIHESGARLMTDAPKDLGGKGTHFSPTDLFAASLASCMMTVLAMAAAKWGVDLTGTTVDVEKEMGGVPRRIQRIKVRFKSPLKIGAAEKEKLEKAALDCPVHHALSKEVQLDVAFNWG